jgi:uncharacterized protein (TIGR00369 family)
MITPEASAAPVDLQMLEDALQQVFAPWVRELDLRVQRASPGEVQLALPVAPRHVHAGGVLCGQTMMAACDSAMVLAVMTLLGGFKPMTTVQLQTSFMRAVPGDSGEARITARVLRKGGKLVFGEIGVHNAAGELAAQATTTYMLL